MKHKPKCQCKTIKIPENDRGENLDDLGYGNDFWNITPKAWSMEEIIDKLDFIKIKNFCSAKDSGKGVLGNEKISHRMV